MRMDRIAFSLLAVALLPCTPAAAQLTPKEAVKLLKSGTSTALKTLKANLKLDEDVFELAIDELAQVADTGAFSMSAFEAFCFQADALQRQVAEHARTASQQAAEAAASAWGGLPMEEWFSLPEGFYIGEAGVLDKFRADARKALDKTYASVRKKLGKLAGRLADKADTRLAFRLEPPADLEAWVCIGPDFPLETEFVALTIDAVFIATDGAMDATYACMSGAANPAGGSVSAGIEYGAGACFGFDTAGVSDERWSAAPDVTFGSPCAANFFCVVDQGDYTAWPLTVGWPGLAP